MSLLHLEIRLCYDFRMIYLQDLLDTCYIIYDSLVGCWCIAIAPIDVRGLFQFFVPHALSSGSFGVVNCTKFLKHHMSWQEKFCSPIWFTQLILSLQYRSLKLRYETLIMFHWIVTMLRLQYHHGNIMWHQVYLLLSAKA